MHIKIGLTENIINECLKLHYGDQPAGKKLKKRLIWIPAILICLGIYLLIDEYRQPEKGSNTIMAFLYIAFAISYYLFMRKRLMKAGKRLLKNLGAEKNFTVDITGHQIVTTTPTFSNTLTWNDFTGALISPENVLLYQSNNTFTMFNYSFFKTGDFEEFKNMVRQNVRPFQEV